MSLLRRTKAVIFDIILNIELRIQIIQTKILQRKVLAKLRDKPCIKCVFFALFEETWKCDDIYKLMVNNPRFDPIILVCPIVNYGYDNMIQRMSQCYLAFLKKGYNVMQAYDPQNNTYIDVRKDINPDLIFYTNPYKGLIDNRYFVTRFQDILTVYVPYFMNCSKVKGFSNNQPLHNLVWRKYAETEYEHGLATIEQIRHGQNVVYTGYPGIEKLISPHYIPISTPWKINDHNHKRIIWAPHHTIEKGIYGHTCFLEYCDFMLEMVKKYEDKAQFVFKPHPILRSKLELLWGKEKTNNYYNRWKILPNSSIQEGDYIDLFLTSDAMIHDSGSFIVEYLYVNKPVMRTINDMALSEVFNQFGLECLNQYYISNTEEEIEIFIQNVINEWDPMKEQRTNFINKELMPNGSPSQNIIDDILDSIDNQILYRN